MIFEARAKWLRKAVEPTALATTCPLSHSKWQIAVRAARAPAGLEKVQIALDLLAWMPMLALAGKPRLWEPRRLRLRLFSTAVQLVTTGRRHYLCLAYHWPWAHLITEALTRLDALLNPG